MKKSFMLSMDVIIGLILLLLFLIFAIAWIQRIFGPKMDEQALNKICSTSVLMNSEQRLPVIETQTIKTKCVTKFTTFHKYKAEQEYESNPYNPNEQIKLPDIIYKDKDKKECKNSNEKDACIFRNINKIISDEMARCWSNFHKGERRVFSIYKKSTERQCLVCSVFMFDNEMQNDYGALGLIGMSHPEEEDYSLDAYMKKNNNLLYTGNQNYYEYTLDLLDKYYDKPYYDYDVKKEYAIVFSAINKNGFEVLTGQLINNAPTLIKDFFSQENEEEGNYINTLWFVPNEEVPKICDLLV